MLEGSVEISTKNILNCLIKALTHLGMPRVAKVTLALNELKWVALHSNPYTTSECAPQVEKNC